MISLAVLLLCAVSGHTLGSTLKQDAVLSLIKQMSNVEERFLLEKKECVEEMQKIKGELMVEIKSSEQRFVENKNEIASKLEQVLARMSEIEKSSNMAVDDLLNRLQVEKNKLLFMNNHLLAEVLELRKKDLDTFEKIANVESEVRDRVTLAESVEQGKTVQEELLVEIKRVERNYLEDKNDLSAEVIELQKRDLDTFGKIANIESELSRDRVRTELLQVRLNETSNKTHACLASQTQIQETMQKNIERLDVIERSDLSSRIGNVENSFKTLRQDLDYVSNRQDDTLNQTVQKNTNDIGEFKQELSRVQTIFCPPCENGGQCVKNVCNCTTFFTGDRCQQVACSPPCENGGQCMRDNICKCTSSFYGDRCQDELKCGVDFDNGRNNGRGNISSDLVWPWMAAVYKNHTSGPVHFCDGSVIHRHFVLTAAWCVYYYRNKRLSVKLGLSDLKIGTHLQEYKVRSAYKHPEFKLSIFYDDYDYDIALLELEEPISFGPFVRPVCLPPPEIPQDELLYKPQSTAKVVRLDEFLSSPQTASPTVLNYTIRSQEECRRKIKEKGFEKLYPLPGLSFCTEISSTKCPYRGSPLMQSRLAGDGVRTWTQVGVKSNCVYEYLFSPRLHRLVEWVEATIAASSKR